MELKIGFIGTGLMGFPMAKNLLKLRHNLKIFNRTKGISSTIIRKKVLNNLKLINEKKN